MSTVNGRFYFKQTSNGNLIGEFSHDKSAEPSTESADRKGEHSAVFVGEYHSTWQEGGTARYANLTITPKPNTVRIFTLEWNGPDGANFVGEGMLCDDILIGDYRTA